VCHWPTTVRRNELQPGIAEPITHRVVFVDAPGIFRALALSAV
jgi:hypothetical protein